jgi:hypothetical protein
MVVLSEEFRLWVCIFDRRYHCIPRCLKQRCTIGTFGECTVHRDGSSERQKLSPIGDRVIKSETISPSKPNVSSLTSYIHRNIHVVVGSKTRGYIPRTILSLQHVTTFPPQLQISLSFYLTPISHNSFA